MTLKEAQKMYPDAIKAELHHLPGGYELQNILIFNELNHGKENKNKEKKEIIY